LDFLGLIVPYPANRALNDQERAHHLKQKQRLNVEPHYQLSVIQMNSTYLESVDKWFAWKGVISALALTLLAIFAGTLGLISIRWLLEAGATTSDDTGFLLANGLCMAAVFVCLAWALIWLLRKESFAYTHYPMRFNRKTRMVHVFRPDGTVLSASWDQLYFTLGHMAQWNDWEVRAHVLDPDKSTVRESFALSYVGSLSTASDQDFVRAHWEFIRRYMEDGPQAVSDQVQFCMPVDGRRESFGVGMERVFANIAGASFPLYCLLFPFCLVVGWFRWIAMRTSEIPQWPADVEASGAIEPGDVYAIKGDASGERVAINPETAAAAGVAFSMPLEADTPPGVKPARMTSHTRRR
jgi:hypothetical protein